MTSLEFVIMLTYQNFLLEMEANIFCAVSRIGRPRITKTTSIGPTTEPLLEVTRDRDAIRFPSTKAPPLPRQILAGGRLKRRKADNVPTNTRLRAAKRTLPVRTPITNKVKPAIEIITQNDKYQYLIS